MKRFEISQVIASFQRIIPHACRQSNNGFAHQNDKNVEAMYRTGIPAILDPNRRTLGGDQQSYYKSMSEFPARVALQWKGESTKVSLLIQPLSTMDETTNKGAAIVCISQFIVFGILKPLGDKGVQGDLRELELSQNYYERSMVLIGDGLTMVRVRTFQDLINQCCFGYSERDEKAVMLQKALSRVISVTGDLHGCFHALACCFRLFYGSLIQPIQSLLKWKRIKGSDVAVCYQQAAGIALMILYEIERQLIVECIAKIENNESILIQLGELDGEAKDIAIFLAKHYMDWIAKQRMETTDKVFMMSLNYVSVMNMYGNLKMAVRSGDSVGIKGRNLLTFLQWGN